jgi:putative membrane-bound dehydrogenase-like protein
MKTVGVPASAGFARAAGFCEREANAAIRPPKGGTPTFVLLFILAQSSTSGLLAADLPRVPPGFTITRVTTPEQVQHPIMGCFDDRGRLYVCESAGTNSKAADLLKNPQDKIVRLEDTDGDGSFDKSVVFADKLVFPQGVLWHEGVVYTCSSPYLWKLEDTDNDGVCDKRTILVKSFGFSGNAADIHGPFLGPEGRLWWCDGRHGHEIRTDKNGLAGGPDNALDIPPKPEPGLPNPDGKLLSQGKAARIFNCKLDGSDVQTFCGGGMDNPVEIDFWETGEVIGTVNLFHGTPRGDCLVHWVWGGVYPRTDQQACLDEFPRTVGPLDEIINYGHVAVSGMCKYRGDQFGKGWDQSVFITLFNTHKVIRTTLERSGSTFKATATEDFVVFDDPDSHPTDVLEDADGSLLVIDTGGWFRIGCPASQVAKPQIGGAIYRIRREGAHQLDDPRGRQIAFADLDLARLIALTRDRRPVVAEEAILELRRREARSEWPELQEDDLKAYVDLVIQGRLNFDQRLRRRVNEVVRALATSDSLTARRQAIEAIERIQKCPLPEKNGLQIEKFHRHTVETAIAAGPVDRFLEHAAAKWFGRQNIDPPARASLVNSSPAVQRAALRGAAVNLRDPRLGNDLAVDDLIPLLGTADRDLQNLTIEVMSRRPDWSERVVEAIERWLLKPPVPPDRREIITRFLATRASEPSVQSFVTKQLGREDVTSETRNLLLQSIADAGIDVVPDAWVSALRKSLSDDPQSQRLAIAAALRHRIPDLARTLDEIAGNKATPTDLRIAAMDVLNVRDQQPLSDSRFQFLRKQIDGTADPVLTATAARVLADSPLSNDQLVALTPAFDSAHSLLAPTLLRAYTNVKDAAVATALLKQLNLAADSLALPALELARVFATAPPEIQKLAAPLLAARGVDPAKQAARLAELTEATKTGNPKAGREVFLSNKALCSRCHRVNGQGETIGPDLSMVGAIRQHHELVEAVVEPSASFVRSYRPVILATADGRVHTGVIASETSTEITLRTADFNEVRIPRADIESFKESDVSIMPAGVDQRLNRTELADLIAYLASLKERKP